MKKTKKKKKCPADYPIISFRIDEDAKNFILKKVSTLETLFNKNTSESDYKIKKNHIYTRALDIGLKALQTEKEIEE